MEILQKNDLLVCAQPGGLLQAGHFHEIMLILGISDPDMEIDRRISIAVNYKSITASLRNCFFRRPKRGFNGNQKENQVHLESRRIFIPFRSVFFLFSPRDFLRG